MYFLIFPPEINSALIYAGAGADPMLMAAAAWDGLAADLRSTAASFELVVAALADGHWSGPAAAAMAAEAAPYVSWLGASAAQAECAAAQARIAATAFEAAQAAAVHPTAVVANRMQLMALVATNFLGQNTPAIAGTEFRYVQMWAQDMVAMVGYHAGALSVASLLTPFNRPPQKLAGLAARAAADVPPPTTPPPPATPPAAPDVGSALQGLVQAAQSGLQTLSTPIGLAISPLMSLLTSAMQGGGTGLAGASTALPDVATLAGGAGPDLKPLGPGAGVGSPISAGLGTSRLVGAMSVPPTWDGSMPARMAGTAMSGLGNGLSAAEMPGAAAAGAASGIPMMPMPMGAGAGAQGGMIGRGGASPHVLQNRPSVIPRAGVG
jgi:PPE-repeat protein